MTMKPVMTISSAAIVIPVVCVSLAIPTCASASYFPEWSAPAPCQTVMVGQTSRVIDPQVQRWVRFQSLVRQWKLEIGSTSSVNEMATTPSYQSIIGMGEAAVPLLLDQLRNEGDDPDHWFWALRAITQEDPVPMESRGNMKKMAEAWIGWAEERGYVG